MIQTPLAAVFFEYLAFQLLETLHWFIRKLVAQVTYTYQCPHVCADDLYPRGFKHDDIMYV